MTRETREDLNEVKILERERGERDATVRSVSNASGERIDPRADRPASRETRTAVSVSNVGGEP
ncbi:hypothetical protein HSR121_1930 [Halapricum desulfuricans]|uniref:Uncharacterized protein n=1 Tax=Halapricum desulfuricans TaxID=2841257 RepID=A0A897N0Q4_9EURY|nr:hypothetical protein HSR121_1930 [Halapricum desulfuricans]